MRKEVIGDCELYLGDCRDLIPTLAVDAVVTDPPYGIDFQYASHTDDIEGWQSLMDAIVPLLRKASPFVVMPSCAIKRLPWWYANHEPDWLIAWHKGSPGHQASIGFNSWEPHVCWGRPSKPMHDYFSTDCGFDPNGHPCPKPLRYAMWLVSRAADQGQTVMDPFMGSGTTGVACIRLGRRFIGIEKDAGYFDIARRRLELAHQQADLFVPSSQSKPVQLSLLESFAPLPISAPSGAVNDVE